MSLGRYASIVVGLAATALAALRAGWGERLEPEAFRAALLGGGLAVANTIVAYALVVWSAQRSTRVFMGAVLGGMVGRMGLMLGAVAVAVLWLELPGGPLAVSLLSFFVVFLVLELAVVPRSGAERART